ncbi:MAG TPA: homocysteine S-methyltransferase family protein [bacterium]|nr:homocysteine S-methyltransferase family protein [bacterium]
MARLRRSLPQLHGGELFLTDGGMETTLIFLEGHTLPEFAAFDLMRRPEGETILRRYYETYMRLAGRFGTGLILESATWRANADWGAKLGYGPKELAAVNRRAIGLLEELRDEARGDTDRIVISGCIGPRGDGYLVGSTMTEEEAERYHAPQVRTLEDTAADLVAAFTINYVEEAVGIARAAERVDLPVVISFTVETDGRLPSGQTLRAAVEHVDAATSCYPAYYMINCAHPAHFDHVLADEVAWNERIRGLRANASRKSHAELNESAELDSGDPADLGARYAGLKRRMPHLNVMGGCCGTDHRHVEQIAVACLPFFSQGR